MRGAYILRVFLVACVFNAIWETAQLPAFAGMSELPLIAHVVGGGGATALDGLFIAGVYLTASWWWRDPSWIERRHVPGFVYAAVLGAVTAIIVEYLALTLGWWSYSEAMPLVPGTGVGLWPFLQLTSLTPLTLWLVGTRWPTASDRSTKASGAS
ncbi:MAG: hypothetical protein GY953_21315 [bacterium]|nr:hypothetical protein [bacterium]